MQIVDVLTAERVELASEVAGGIRTKLEALHVLSQLLAKREGLTSADEVERVLIEREKLQSTGVGGGVAIPHGAIERPCPLTGAVLLCRQAIPFDAIDGAPVSILFALIGPKRAPGEHLKALARVSRLLRDDGFRKRLLGASTGAGAFGLIVAEEARVTAS
jgi:PTS system nitrogen regulatory IIA component